MSFNGEPADHLGGRLDDLAGECRKTSSTRCGTSGVFTAAKAAGPGEPLCLQMHRMRSGEHRITVMVASKPARAGIDPRNLLIDVEGDDNLKEITRPEGQQR